MEHIHPSSLVCVMQLCCVCFVCRRAGALRQLGTLAQALHTTLDNQGAAHLSKAAQPSGAEGQGQLKPVSLRCLVDVAVPLLQVDEHILWGFRLYLRGSALYCRPTDAVMHLIAE